MADTSVGALTAQRLRDLLLYDPETGIFTNRVHRGSTARAGQVVGADDGNGYLQTMIERKLYRLHRLAVFYVSGEWPEGDVDHEDGIRSNNRWKNLRPKGHQFNCENQRRSHCDSATGFLGVTPARGKYEARISARGRNRYLGNFDTPEKAHEAYVAAKRKVHEGCTL